MHTLSIKEKIALLKKKFSQLHTSEEKYALIMDFGKKANKLSEQYKKPEHLVAGCQSLLYLHTYLENGKMRIATESDALISAGLAALVASIYDNESPETILQNPPTFLEEMEITDALSPSRAQGLYSLIKRIQKDALQFLLQKQTS